MDHVIPLAKQGPNTIDNIVPARPGCTTARSRTSSCNQAGCHVRDREELVAAMTAATRLLSV
ncbi:HNH endonuclease [Mycobacteroides salmoniphilum]|uniref:HNH endonuclease n=1 Tax=Mycobacteroides salmoniphilum TaxID=404941 RepID=UPI0039E01705